MDESFINKVRLIILEHLEDERFNVGDLASNMGFSQSQVLRKIKASTGKFPNQIIREIRLEEATKLIRENKYTASEIAYRVGFGSPSYFNKCFHDHFGVTPGEFKDKRKEVIQENNDRLDSDKVNYFSKRKTVYLILIFVSAVFVTLFFIRRNIIRKNKLENSIAVLYFDDMSSSSDTQWFCDGITDEIHTHLSKLKKLKVISRTSVKRFKNSDKSIPKIAKELGVSYIVEGSVKKHNDLFRITVKLLNRYDETVWSQEYDKKIDSIIKIQREVSKKIVQELHVVISPEEEKLLNTFPTDNLKAYESYLKARSFAESRTKKYFDLSIRHYKQAIDLDPDFADAYAEMALTYLNNHWVDETNWEENKNKAGLLVDQALNVDPNCAKAYAAKAKFNFHNDKLEEIKDNFENALKLNPNDPIIHRDMAFYYSRSIENDVNKSLYHINKAIELDPFSSNINQRKIYILLKFSKLKEAKEFYKNNGTLFSEEVNIDIQNYFIRSEARIIGLEKKDMMESIKFLHHKIQDDPHNSNIYLELGGQYNGILNDDLNYIKYTKKAYSLDSVIWENAWNYSLALIDGKRFAVAEKLINSKNYRKLMSDSQLLDVLSRYYYNKEDYDAAMTCVNDSLMPNNYNKMEILVLAQKGDVDRVRNILNNNFFYNYKKAQVFAILNERDSMYYYLNNTSIFIGAGGINGSKDLDPYRKEERYKAFLKKNYLPITSLNE